MPHNNPYDLAGPFSASTALLGIASARAEGRNPLPEAGASLIADLMAAGLSPEATFQIQKSAEEMAPLPPTTDHDRSLLTVLEGLLQRTHAVLGTELRPDQVQAFSLGAALCLSCFIALAPWSSGSTKKTLFVDELARAKSLARTLGVGEAEISAFVSAAEAPWSLPTLIVPDVLRASGVILNALLHR